MKPRVTISLEEYNSMRDKIKELENKISDMYKKHGQELKNIVGNGKDYEQYNFFDGSKTDLKRKMEHYQSEGYNSDFFLIEARIRGKTFKTRHE